MLNVSVSEQYSFCIQSYNYRNAEEINEAQKTILTKIQTEHYESTASKAVNFVRENPGTIGSALIPTQRELVTLFAYEFSAASLALPICFIQGGTPVGVGFLGGVLAAWYGIVTVDKLSQIKNTPFYQAWRDTRNLMLEKKHLNDFLIQDNQLKYFVCDLSGKLPLIPVKIKGTDKVFDFEEIERWNHENPGKIFPPTNKVLNLQELVFDFPHMQSMMERLENLRQKTILAIDPKIYTYNVILKEAFDQTFGITDINAIVVDYLGLDTDVELQEDNTYKLLKTRVSHPLLSFLSKQTKIFQRSIVENKKQLQQTYRRELLAQLANENLDSLRNISAMLETLKDLNKRKVMWYNRSNSPVYSTPDNTPIPWGKVIPAAILLSPILLPILYGGAVYAITDHDLNEKSKVLKVVDLTEVLDSRIIEYSRVS